MAYLRCLLFFWALVPLFVQQVSSLVESVPGLVESLLAFLSDLGFDLSAIDPQTVGRQLVEGIEGLAPGIGPHLQRPRDRFAGGLSH